jgi:hypothetical protein
MSAGDDPNPSDEKVEESIRKERRYLDPDQSSIQPSFLENDGIKPSKKVSRDMLLRESSENVQDNAEIFDELSSDKEEDTTEGEITDVHTAD